MTSILPSPPLPEAAWKALAEAEAAAENASGIPPGVEPEWIGPSTTGVRRCFGCNMLYAAAAALPTIEQCPGCKSKHTVVVTVNPDAVGVSQTAVVFVAADGKIVKELTSDEFKAMTPEQLAKWKETLAHRQARLEDEVWRYCVPCKKKYSTEKIHCPKCNRLDTYPCESGNPRQTHLFVIPPPPRPNAWIVECKWKALGKVRRSPWSQPPAAWKTDPMNDWQRYSERNITTERQAVNQVARLRRVFPWQSWRVRAVGWNPTPLLP